MAEALLEVGTRVYVEFLDLNTWIYESTRLVLVIFRLFYKGEDVSVSGPNARLFCLQAHELAPVETGLTFG